MWHTHNLHESYVFAAYDISPFHSFPHGTEYHIETISNFYKNSIMHCYIKAIITSVMKNLETEFISLFCSYAIGMKNKYLEWFC